MTFSFWNYHDIFALARQQKMQGGPGGIPRCELSPIGRTIFQPIYDDHYSPWLEVSSKTFPAH